MPINDFNSSSLSTARKDTFAPFSTSPQKTLEICELPLTLACRLVDEIISLQIAEQVQLIEAACAVRAGREVRRGEEDPI
jgi:hypothetical protein